MLIDYLKKKNISLYELSKGSGVPYTTVREFANKKEAVDKVTYLTFKKIKDYLNLSVEELYKISCGINEEIPQINPTWEQARDNIYHFPIIVDNKNYDASRIYPLMQNDVNNIYHKIKEYKGIKKVILFGSAVNIRCTHNSDLDIAIELNNKYLKDDYKNEISEVIEKITNYNCDILWINSLEVDSEIYKNIMKGVTIYE